LDVIIASKYKYLLSVPNEHLKTPADLTAKSVVFSPSIRTFGAFEEAGFGFIGRTQLAKPPIRGSVFTFGTHDICFREAFLDISFQNNNFAFLNFCPEDSIGGIFRSCCTTTFPAFVFAAGRHHHAFTFRTKLHFFSLFYLK